MDNEDLLGTRGLAAVTSLDYWRTTAEELAEPRAGGIPFGVIWFYRILNIALNSLNLFWFYKMANGAMRVVAGCNPDSTHQEVSKHRHGARTEACNCCAAWGRHHSLQLLATHPQHCCVASTIFFLKWNLYAYG